MRAIYNNGKWQNWLTWRSTSGILQLDFKQFHGCCNNYLTHASTSARQHFPYRSQRFPAHVMTEYIVIRIRKRFIVWDMFVQTKYYHFWWLTSRTMRDKEKKKETVRNSPYTSPPIVFTATSPNFYWDSWFVCELGTLRSPKPKWRRGCPSFTKLIYAYGSSRPSL